MSAPEGTTYEVWSISSANMYGQVFSDEMAARDILRKSCASWPEDEFAILVNEPGKIPYVLDEQEGSDGME